MNCDIFTSHKLQTSQQMLIIIVYIQFLALNYIMLNISDTISSILVTKQDNYFNL